MSAFFVVVGVFSILQSIMVIGFGLVGLIALYLQSKKKIIQRRFKK